MNIKKILITSDDGYNSLGVRILTHILKDEYHLKIAGTLDQMSGVGGKLSLGGGKFSSNTVDGVEAICVEGTPTDAVEVANSYFQDAYDMVISGINWGQNVGGSVVSSGTVSAALRALATNIAPKAIALSWKIPAKHWVKRHNGKESVEEFIKYPGVQAKKCIQEAIKNDLWGANMLNINFPSAKTTQAVFTQPIRDQGKYYSPVHLDFDTFKFSYPISYNPSKETDTQYDSVAIEAGLISITPFKGTYLNEKVWHKISQQKIVI
jgi:5'/3'-nucleotidase SurE